MLFNKKDWKRLGTASFYLAPNIFGFAVFVLFPLIFSIIMAFTNWDLKQHNMFRDNSVAYVGFDNFLHLFADPDFMRYLGNTLIMMVGIPFGMIGSLLAAMLLSSSLKGENKGDGKLILTVSIILTGVMLLSTVALMLAGMKDTAIMLVIISFVGVMLIGGSTIGSTVYRTIFYLPSFTSGVAIFLLWKKIFSPENGPLNEFLRGPIESFSGGVAALPSGLVQACLWLGYAGILILQYYGFKYLRRTWRDGETGITGCILGAISLSVPVLFAWFWMPTAEQNGIEFIPMYSFVATFLLLCGNIIMVAKLVTDMYKYRDFKCASDYGLGT
ncbi:MAG: sugar ABC transporter permease, partial [Planctomycetes bacterium]|nr:sugar ABC transporter permease [Planctomycetota bacterium]